MGAVKRTHRQARERQQSIRAFRKNKAYRSLINHICGQFNKTVDKVTAAYLIPKCVIDSIMVKVDAEIINGSSTLDPFGVLWRCR